MKYVLIYYMILMFQPFVISQDLYNGVYINKENDEFICFYNDSLQFRILNNDAFGTYAIGKGIYSIDRKGVLYLQCDNIKEETSSIHRHQRNDKKIVVKVLSNDNEPMEFVTIKIGKKQGGDFHIIATSDKSGCLTLDKKQINYFNNESVFVYVETVGFITAHNVLLEFGYDYVIKSRIPEMYPFSLIKDGSKIRIEKDCNTQEIKAKIAKNIKSELSKLNMDLKSPKFLFNKGVTSFQE